MKTPTAIILFLSCLASTAQSYSPWTFTLTNSTVAGASSINVNSAFSCSKQQAVAIQVTGNLSASTNATLTLTFARSIDNSNYTATAWSLALYVTNTAGAFTPMLTNAPAEITYGSGYLKLTSISNSTGGVNITNLVVKAAQKTMSP